MGAAATTARAALELKDEMLSLEEVQRLYGDEFDGYIFNTLKDEDGLVQRDDLKNVVKVKTDLIATTLTKATLAVFQHYSAGSTDMKPRQLCDMCRDGKLLNKTKFSNADANMLNEKVLKMQRIATKSLTYEIFRKDLIPAIAEKRFANDDLDFVLSKFGSIGLPSEVVIFDEAVKGKEDFEPVSDAQKKAAVKLQSLSRQKSVAKEMEELKEIIKIVPEIKDDFFSYPETGEMEAKILDVFCTYCADGIITKTLLVQLLKKTDILHQQRTIYDCKMAFTKAELLAKTRGCYKSGVIANKFLTYRVFREVLLPCLGERFKCTTEKILEALRKLESNNIPAMSAAGAVISGLFVMGASSRKCASSMRTIRFSCGESEYADI